MLALTTDRLTIRPLAAPDAPAFAAYRAAPDVARYQSWDAGYAVEDALRLAADQPDGLPGPGGWLQLAVVETATGTLLGDVAVHRLADQPDTFELGATTSPAAQRRDVALEAVGTVLDHLIHAEAAHRVIASCDVRNVAAASLLRRLGFRHEGRELEADWFKDEWTSVDRWAVLGRERRGAGA